MLSVGTRGGPRDTMPIPYADWRGAMIGGAAMVKKPKAKAKGQPDPGVMTTRALKMRQEYADWMERFASHERVTLASLIDRALASHAERAGFDEPPSRT